MARLFGFGSPTGIAGLGEEAGLVPDAEWKLQERGEDWFAGDEVNLGIGQGDLLMTPLQLANAYSSFTARQLRTPVIVEGATAEPRGEIPLSAEQFAALQQGLQMVTSPGGTANYAFSGAGYPDFAGKSGTAEDTGLQQHVLFVTYSPAAAPRALAAVILDDGQSGSLEAGPIARDLVLSALAAE
jgi:penicillin-binding protein 2